MSITADDIREQLRRWESGEEPAPPPISDEQARKIAALLSASRHSPAAT